MKKWHMKDMHLPQWTTAALVIMAGEDSTVARYDANLFCF